MPVKSCLVRYVSVPVTSSKPDTSQRDLDSMAIVTQAAGHEGMHAEQAADERTPQLYDRETADMSYMR